MQGHTLTSAPLVPRTFVSAGEDIEVERYTGTSTEAGGAAEVEFGAGAEAAREDWEEGSARTEQMRLGRADRYSSECARTISIEFVF